MNRAKHSISRANAALQIRAESPASLDALALADLWNGAMADDMPTSARLLTWALTAQPPRQVALWVAYQAGAPVGFVVASHLGDGALGWVDALAVPVRPNRAAVRTGLLDSAMAWLHAAGCSAMQVGGGARSLMRGVLQASQRADYFVSRDYDDAGRRFDMHVDLARYAPPADAPVFAGVVRPPHPRDRDDVDALLADSSALWNGALDSDADNAALLPVLDTLRDGRFADLMLLWSGRGLEGLILLIFADSATPLDVVYPYGLPRPWTGLGPVLLRADSAMGHGGTAAAAGMLFDASLRRLHNNGANSCVATGVRDRALYAQYGFKPLRTWQAYVKRL